MSSKNEKGFVINSETIFSEENADIIKHYELVVTADPRTRLKILKMRGKKLKSKQEVDSIGYKMHEATVIPITKTWKELGINSAEPSESTMATPLGQLKGKKLERLFQLLERFREIIEDKSLSPPEKVKRVGKIESKHFPNYITERTAKIELSRPFMDIEGVSETLAIRIFDEGIYTKKQLSKLSRKELTNIKGVGKVKSKQIIEGL